MKKKAILFDLDGTLLPMDQDEFVRAYFNELAKKICPFGYEKRHVIDSIWDGINAMVKNDGRAANEDLFWAAFTKLMGEKALDLKDEFTSFYRNEFDKVKTATGKNSLAAKAVKLAREKTGKVILATNPLFPACGVETRLRWIGLDLPDFDLVTTYENSTYCKPNPKYFKEILEKMDLAPEDCLMVGNDLKEDAETSRKAGIEPFLVTDCLISSGKELGPIQNGTFEDLIGFLKALS